MRRVASKGYGWTILHESKNSLDGHRVWIGGAARFPRPEMFGAYNCALAFSTREAARNFIRDEYGYMKNRPDLRAEPHGWRTPKPVRVSIKVETIA